MQNSFFQKLIMTIIAGALAAGFYEFYRVFVEGSMRTVGSSYTEPAPYPTPTPRRF